MRKPLMLPCPSFPCFWENGQENPPKKQGFFYPYRTPKIPGKEGKTLKQNKEFLTREKKGIPQKTRKGRTGHTRIVIILLRKLPRKSCNVGQRCQKSQFLFGIERWRFRVSLRWGLRYAIACDAKSLAIRVEQCEQLRVSSRVAPSSTIRTSWITLPHVTICVSMTPPITPKRNPQKKTHLLVFSS